MASKPDICPQCGGLMTHGASLCRSCVGKTASKALSCPQCGAPKGAKAKLCRACKVARRGSFNGAERAKWGAVVTFENSKGETLSIHREGPVLKAVASACWIALGMDETAKVVCISTPASIFADLQGSRRINEASTIARARLPRSLVSPSLLGKIRPRNFDGFDFR